FDAFGDLPQASSLCGACTETCPVKIPLHDYLIELRTDRREQGAVPFGERLAFWAWAHVMTRPGLYRLAQRLGRRLYRMAARDGQAWGPGAMSGGARAPGVPAGGPGPFRGRGGGSLAGGAPASGTPAAQAAGAAQPGGRPGPVGPGASGDPKDPGGRERAD